MLAHEMEALARRAEEGDMKAADQLPMSAWSEQRRENMTARTIAANYRLYVAGHAPSEVEVPPSSVFYTDQRDLDDETLLGKIKLMTDVHENTVLYATMEEYCANLRVQLAELHAIRTERGLADPSPSKAERGGRHV